MSDLREPDRLKLDGIVKQMMESGESDDNIQNVVNDFKSKYGQPGIKEKADAFTNDLISGVREHPKEVLTGGLSAAGDAAMRVVKRLGSNVAGMFMQAVNPAGSAAEMGQELGRRMAFKEMPTVKEGVKLATGVNVDEGYPEMAADFATGVALMKAGGMGKGKLVKGAGGGPPPPPSSPRIPLTGASKVVSVPKELIMNRTPMEAPTNLVSPAPREMNASQFMGRTSTTVPAPRRAIPDVAMANGLAKAEAAAEAAAAGRTEPAGRAPVYGVEKRSPSRISGKAEDAAYEAQRAKIAKKAAEARAKEMGENLPTLREGMTPEELAKAAEQELQVLKKKPGILENKVPPIGATKVEVPKPMASVEKEGTGGIHDRMPQNENIGAEKGVLEGFTKKPTKSLTQMVEQYGKEGAANRAGMSVDELEVRIAAGDDPAKLAKGLRDRLGAEKAGRILGMSPDDVRRVSGGGPSRLPSKAVAAIKAAAEREKAETGSVSEKTQTLLDRIKSEGGAAKVKAILPLTGAVGGGVYGATQGDTEGEHVNNAILGALGGGALGAAPMLPWGKLGKTAFNVRRESLLSGLAIPKNMAQMVGNAVWAAAENKNPMALKELFRLPTNVKEYVTGMKQADPYTYSSVEQPYAQGAKGPLRFFQPSHHIAAIDRADMMMLKRMGIPDAEIPRYMMNSDDDIIRAITNHSTMPEEYKPTLRTLVRVGFPFTRFATNQAAGVGREFVQVLNGIKNAEPSIRMAMNIGATGGGAALGKWAGNDPKRRLIATALLPLFGPGQGLATLGAITTQGVRGLGAGAFGGLSPLPEEGFNPAQFVNPKRWFGFKPAAVTAAEKLSK